MQIFNNIINLFKQPKIYCIYNTCGMAYDNTIFYRQAINNLLSQKYSNYKVIVSACCHKQHQINNLYNLFKNKLNICHIKDRVPVQVSFNFTIREVIKKHGPADGYLYIDSGVSFEKNNLVLKNLSKILKQEYYYLIQPETQEIKHFLDTKGRTFLKPGETIPLVCGLFSHKWYEAFNKILPDIFVGLYMEDTFPFITAGLQSKVYIAKNIKLMHKAEMDGTALLAECTPWMQGGGKLWAHPYLISTEDFLNRLTGPNAKRVGLGYAEAVKVSLHDKALYNNNGDHINSELLLNYIKNNLFLSKDLLDYNTIDYEWL